MINENIRVCGVVHATLIDEHGNVKQQDSRNMVVGTGLAYIASRMKDTTANVVSHVAAGTNTGAATLGQTALLSETGRAALSSTTIVTTTTTNDSVQYVGTIGPGVATSAITELGLFNAASEGTMVARTVFPVINKGALDSLVVTWKITIA